MHTEPIPQNRYHRQMLLPQLRPAGQQRLARSRILLIGCGALGAAAAELLIRAGVGSLRIADRDLVEFTNLQRQLLFDEEDARRALPKAVAAAQRLQRINSEAAIEPLVLDVHPGNIEDLLRPPSSSDAAPACDLILDGTDNLETRYLINDLAVKHAIPWIYSACIGTEGRIMAVRPGRSPCLRCIFPTPPAGADVPTCDTAGVLGPAATLVASIQATLAIKLLTRNAVADELLTFDLWENRFRSISLADARRDDCPCCSRRCFDFLDSPHTASSVALCGRNAVQIRPPAPQQLNLATLADRLSPLGQIHRTPHFLRCDLHDPPGIRLTIFPDARLLVHGTTDLARARSLAARFIGA